MKHDRRITEYSIRLLRTLLPCVLLALLVYPNVAQTSGAVGHKNVLVLYDEQTELPGLAILDRSLRSALTSGSSVKIDVYSETLDLSRFQEESYFQFLRDYFRRKYSSKKIDAVIAVMDPSLDFMLAYGEEISPGTPIVFCGVGRREIERRSLGPKVTGVLVKREFKGTLDLALRLQPDTQRAVFISGTSMFDKQLAEQALGELREYEGRLAFTYLTNLSLNDLLKEVSQLPPHTIILFSTLFRDGAGEAFVPHDAVSLISQKANAPVYGFLDQFLGLGIVGGHLYSLEAHGNKAAELTLRVLGGEKAADIPIVEGAGNVDMFDWRELRRWGISESRLPPGSIVRFQEPSIWDEYKWQIIGLIVLLIVQSAFIVGMVINLIRRKRAEQSLRQSESRNRAMLTALPDLIFIITREGIYLDYHAKDPGELFVPPESFIGRSMREVLPQELAQSFERCMEQTAQSSEPVILEYSLQTGSEERCYESSMVKLDGDRVMCIVRDITRRKKAEMRLRRYFELPLIGMAITSPDRRFVEVNQELCDMLGYSMDELTGKSWVDVSHPDDVAENVRLLEQTLSGETEGYTMEKRFIHRDGNTVYSSISARCVRRADRTVDHLVLVLQKITERKRAEEALLQTQSELAHVGRVMITGELAATIAHEVNQPLTAVVANANAARRMLGNGKLDLEAREAIDDIIKDAHRASQVVAYIRSLLKKGFHRTEPLAMNEVIEEVVAIVRNNLARKRVLLRMEMAADLPEVEADRVEMQQVILNLVMNAVEAMSRVENGGRGRVLLMRTARDESGGVLVEVVDSGVGIALENLEHIFDAFYTTNPEGMGMGLSICRTIIEAHGGRLWAQSNEDRGATFRFALPASNGSVS